MSFLEDASVISPLVVYALAVPMPGPSFVIITQASLGGGRLAGMIAAIGTTVGVAAYATATLLGISALSAALPWLFTIIRVLGGLYLVYLGIQALRAAIRGEGSFTTARRPDERLSIARTFSKALLVSLGNPKRPRHTFSGSSMRWRVAKRSSSRAMAGRSRASCPRHIADSRKSMMLSTL